MSDDALFMRRSSRIRGDDWLTQAVKPNTTGVIPYTRDDWLRAEGGASPVHTASVQQARSKLW